MGRVTALPPSRPSAANHLSFLLSLLDSNCIYGAPLFENSIKILCKEGVKEGRVEVACSFVRSLARWTDSFWRFGEQQKVKLAAENK